jgi:hypothetical protein
MRNPFLKQEKFLKHNKGEYAANFNEIRRAKHRGGVEMTQCGILIIMTNTLDR